MGMRLLIVEDKDSFRRLLVRALEGSAWEVTAVGNPAEAFEMLRHDSFEAMVTDLRLPEFSGLELLKRAKRLQPGLRVVLMSAFGEPRDIVEAMRHGADDFLGKPFDLDLFHEVLERLGSLVGAPPPDPREPWIAQSPAMRALDEGLSRAAESDVNTLFLGERGVGKVRAARRLHSLRHTAAPFLALASETVGPEGPEPSRLKLLKGGSLFLANLETLSVTAVPGLLQAMESEAGQRIHWMAGARDLVSLLPAVRDRLGVLCFPLPPLRERKEDILPLFRMLLEAGARREGRPTPLMERTAERDLLTRDWRGNVRELAWCVSQALRTQEGAVLGALPHLSSGAVTAPLCISWPEPDTLEAMQAIVGKAAEALLLRRALQAHGGEVAHTASALGLTARTLAQRLREHRISID
jgi:DNA-binding NtrC family response regulator